MTASAHFSARITSASPFRRARVAELQLQVQSLEGDEACCQHTGNAKLACRRQRADQAAEVVERKVSCGWARGCNTGHGSCLSLPLVSCVAASGTAALSTSETGRDHHALGTLHHLTV
ncbi:hypothetical protein F2P79_013040 [Pimephales promelas]|nr:hypothetical protein F2P79_013040 [Pimephales promelas]